MKKMIVGVLIGFGAGYLAFGSHEAPTEPTFVTVDGSSTVFPISEAVAEEFQKENPDVRVTVGVSGTGGGFKKFCNGETDISNASRPIKASEMELCAAAGIEFIELPVAFDGIAIVKNPENEFLNEVTVEELSKIWEPAAQGTITTWNQVNPEWPEEEIVLYGPGTDSGTFDYFTDAINGEEGASRGDYTASEDDNVLVQGVSGDQFSLGYFALAYYENNEERLGLVSVDDGTGAVAASAETVADGTYQPLSRPVFVYVSTAALERPEVAKFVAFHVAQADSLVEEVGYISLGEALYTKVLERVESSTTGSEFDGGSTVGVKLEDVL